jgi:thiamine-phosphate pyrophosphorylase
VLDANCNRIREALRVIEEYYRFISENESAAIELKKLRHELISIEDVLGREQLLEHRDSETDCFADHVRPEEMRRENGNSLLTANFKRAQEAARVLEEYTKITPDRTISEKAKRIRFSLYRLEKMYGSM